MYTLKRLSVRLLRNLAADAWRARTRPAPRMLPVLMTHFVTYRCNFRCSYCNVRPGGSAPPSTGELGTEDCVRLIGILREAVPHLHLTGGEPLLRTDIVEIVAAARALGFRSLGLSSNLSLSTSGPPCSTTSRTWSRASTPSTSRPTPPAARRG